MPQKITPTGREVFFDRNELIVSKTDLKGRITYANDLFQSISGFSERELLGQPHSIVRHRDMPRSVFMLLWETIQQGGETFLFVKNITKYGDHYWVLTHVTPSFDSSGQITGYHSNRRVPRREAIAAIEPIYADILRTETDHHGGEESLEAGSRRLKEFVSSTQKSYDELILSL